MKFGIVIFPGTNCDHDCFHVIVQHLGHEAVFLWYKETDLQACDCIMLPGGFAYGDYLRAGSMASIAPIMTSIRAFAKKGGMVLGICNGFQILVEALLLPGVLMRNRSLTFLCRDVFLRVEGSHTPFTASCRNGEVLRMPIAHMEGSFFLERRALDKLVASHQILFRYCTADGNLTPDANPNGSVEAIAGVCNEEGNVCGLMPHPERASEFLLGNQDGLKIFASMVDAWTKRNQSHGPERRRYS